jgi:hypothetical protein
MMISILILLRLQRQPMPCQTKILAWLNEVEDSGMKMEERRDEKD